MRSAIAAIVLILAVASPAQSFEWRAKVSHCEPTRSQLIARHLQCERDPVVAPCGKIQAVGADLGGLARFEVLWKSGTRSEVRSARMRVSSAFSPAASSVTAPSRAPSDAGSRRPGALRLP